MSAPRNDRAGAAARASTGASTGAGTGTGTGIGIGIRTVYTVEWLPGSDLLLGICFCGARQEADDPTGLWSWLLGHPRGHAPVSSPSDRTRRGGGDR